ncbi:MAG: branched-chain amino acid ABC transporter substrate-binding protein [Micromonosporaceae bacterium]
MKQKFTRAVGGAVMAVALLGATVGCGGGGDSGGEELKIGFMGALTGDAAAIVEPPHNAAKLAIDEYNKTNPETKIKLVSYDTQGLPDQGPGQAQQAVQDGVVGMIGPAFSGESKVVGQILEESKIPSVSPSATAADLATQGWKYWHRVLANDDIQGPEAARFMVDKMGAKKIFVISDEQEYSVGLKGAVMDTLEEEGVTVQSDQIKKEASDYSSTVNKVKAADPDAVFYGGYYAEAGRLLKQLRDGGVEAPFASADGSLDDALVEGAGKDNAEGALLVCPCNIGDPGNEAAKKFSDAYQAKFDVEPKIYGSEGYDAATAFINAIKEGNTTAEEINKYLKTIEFEGVSKPIAFNPNGELKGGDIYLYRVENGEIMPKGIAKDAEYTK